jgi:hypothetical protein
LTGATYRICNQNNADANKGEFPAVKLLIAAICGFFSTKITPGG